MEKNLAQKLYRRLKGLGNDFPKDMNGMYRGYLDFKVSNNLTEIFDFLLKEENTFSYLKKKIENLLSILPHNHSAKVHGYMNTDTGVKLFNLIEEILTFIPISQEEKDEINLIAESKSISNCIFSVNSSQSKISRFCFSMTRTDYDPIILNDIVDINSQNFEGITILTVAVQKKTQKSNQLFD